MGQGQASAAGGEREPAGGGRVVPRGDRGGAGGGDGDESGVVERLVDSGQRGAGAGFPLGAGQPDEYGGGDASCAGELVVVAELVRQLLQGFGAAVVLQEPFGGAGALVVPAAVGVGADDVAEVSCAAGLGPPGGQAFGGAGAAGAGDERGEQAVDAGGVGQVQGVGDGHGGVVAVGQGAGVEAVFGGEDGGAGDVEDVVHGGGAGGGEGLEAVSDPPAVELDEALVGGPDGGPADSGYLVGGQDFVFVQDAGQPGFLYSSAALQEEARV